jgi:hypothetical protein
VIDTFAHASATTVAASSTTPLAASIAKIRAMGEVIAAAARRTGAQVSGGW